MGLVIYFFVMKMVRRMTGHYRAYHEKPRDFTIAWAGQVHCTLFDTQGRKHHKHGSDFERSASGQGSGGLAFLFWRAWFTPPKSLHHTQ